MSKINDLINKLCPNGVEFKSLDKISSITTGKLNANAMVEDGEYAFFTCDAKPFRIDKYAFDGEAILISGNGSQVGHLNYYIGKFNAYQRTYVLMSFIDSIIPKYLYHYLNTYLKGHIDENSKKGSIPYITLPMLQGFNVPIPPLEVQNEIVRILDKFGELEAELEVELEVELEARKSQYEFWRARLFDKDFEIVKLGDLCSIKTGSKPAEILEIGKYEYINAGTSNSGYTNEKNAVGNCVTTPSRGQGGIGYVAFQSRDFWCGPLCYQIRALNNNLSNKYLYYYMLTNSKYILGLKHEGGVPSVNVKELQEMPIVLPPLEEQNHIVSILDKFDALVNDITVGLPAEKELRRKQYEYYRNKLLNFEDMQYE